MDPVSIKILNRDGDDLVVWAVNVQPGFGPGRLCGAWITGDPATHQLLLRRQWTLVLPDAADLIPNIDGGQLLDVELTRSAIVDEFERLAQLNREARTPAGNRRAPLPAVNVPESFDVAAVPATLRGVTSDSPAVVTTIAAAHHLAALAAAWEQVEGRRTARDYLVDGQPAARPFPAIALA